ncbi:MAG: glycerophosphodiester phosphodiesterase family protein [Maricaulaceae bacterium]
MKRTFRAAPWAIFGSLWLANAAAAPIAAASPMGDFLACLRDGGALISAHRGGPQAGLPENSLATFQAVAARHSAFIETDVRQTIDGVLVLHHDDDLERTSTGAGALGEQDWVALSRLRLIDNDGGETGLVMTRLDEALAWAKDRRVVLNLDIKRGVDRAAVVDAIETADAVEDILVIADSLEDAAAYAALNSALGFTIPARSLPEMSKDPLIGAGVDPDRVILWLGVGDPDPEDVAQSRAAGFAIGVGTFGSRGADSDQDPAGYRALARSGVDMIATDFPYIAAAALDDDPGLDAERGCPVP